MFGSGSNSTEVNRIASYNRSKNAPGNRTDVGWKHGIHINGNGKKVKCSYCSKIVSGGIFRFKIILLELGRTLNLVVLFQKK